jgi:hypothetical protein
MFTLRHPNSGSSMGLPARLALGRVALVAAAGGVLADGFAEHLLSWGFG